MHHNTHSRFLPVPIPTSFQPHPYRARISPNQREMLKANPQALWGLRNIERRMERAVLSTSGNPSRMVNPNWTNSPDPPGPGFSFLTPGTKRSKKQIRALHVCTEDLAVSRSTSLLTSFFSPSSCEAPVPGFPPPDAVLAGPWTPKRRGEDAPFSARILRMCEARQPAGWVGLVAKKPEEKFCLRVGWERQSVTLLVESRENGLA